MYAVLRMNDFIVIVHSFDRFVRFFDHSFVLMVHKSDLIERNDR